MEKLSVSLEDYIEEIYIQVLKNGQAKVKKSFCNRSFEHSFYKKID